MFHGNQNFFLPPDFQPHPRHRRFSIRGNFRTSSPLSARRVFPFYLNVRLFSPDVLIMISGYRVLSFHLHSAKIEKSHIHLACQKYTQRKV